MTICSAAIEAGALAQLVEASPTVSPRLKNSTHYKTYPVSGHIAVGFQFQDYYQHLLPPLGQHLQRKVLSLLMLRP